MRKRPYLTVILTAIIAVSLGVIIGRYSVPETPRNTVLREKGYELIDPVLQCNTNLNSQSQDNALSKKIQKYVDAAPQRTIGVYYANFDMRAWAGVNIDERFSPASMLKVPTMTAILRYADEHPDVLEKKIYYNGDADDNGPEYFKPQKALTPGRSYTVAELIEHMIKYSDNNAANILSTEAISEREFNDIYLDLDIQLPTSLGDIMSPWTYTTFLRLLYNSSYLTRMNSQKALQIKTQADFPQGMRAGVASSTTVAQKFGERRFLNPAGATLGVELHDCGIVYAKTSYALCIMTRGEPGVMFEDLAKDIENISKIIYDYQDSE